MAHLNTAWDDFVAEHPQTHILQTATWGNFKTNFGWDATVVRARQQGALVLFRRLPLGLTLAYVPRGPLANWDNLDDLRALLTELDATCRARGAICLKLEPDIPDVPGFTGQLAALGFQPSPHTVQPRRTLVVDLSGEEKDVLARMKQKTRYNIGLSTKKEVASRLAETPEDLDAFIGLMGATGERDRFAVHSAEYYQQAYELFRARGQCALFLAEYQGEPLAGVMTFALGKWAWYLYGASSDKERNRMAPYLVQWEAMRWAKAQGALNYDLWGVPDENEETLETEFETRHDGLWGVYRFKRGWGGRLVRTIGAWDRVYQPILYRAYLMYLQLRQQTLAG